MVQQHFDQTMVHNLLVVHLKTGSRNRFNPNIDPGSPWQNGYVESFHDKFRRECLGREIFYTLTDCWVVVNDWKRKYNQVRPHRSLGMLTPVEFAKNHSNRAKILPYLRLTASTPKQPWNTALG